MAKIPETLREKNKMYNEKMKLVQIQTKPATGNLFENNIYAVVEDDQLYSITPIIEDNECVEVIKVTTEGEIIKTWLEDCTEEDLLDWFNDDLDLSCDDEF